ncbi:hypothetical protein TNCV_4267481 [Trichonephila clavipes]|nr:hypothetical protein TNCV_4267481 [Trichonephila clavipes]
MPKARSKVSRKRKFYGNRFTKLALNSNNSTSVREAKLSTFDSFDVPEPEFHGSTGNRIIGSLLGEPPPLARITLVGDNCAVMVTLLLNTTYGNPNFF